LVVAFFALFSRRSEHDYHDYHQNDHDHDRIISCESDHIVRKNMVVMVVMYRIYSIILHIIRLPHDYQYIYMVTTMGLLEVRSCFLTST
jgi:hypothetical protein